MVVVVTYIRWRKGVKLPRLKMSPTISERFVCSLIVHFPFISLVQLKGRICIHVEIASIHIYLRKTASSIAATARMLWIKAVVCACF